MLRAIMAAGLVVFASCVSWAQTAETSPSFEVASVKPAAPIAGNGIRVMLRGGPGTPDPGQITYTNVTVKNVLTNAYGVKSFQISGPGWLDSERYDIVAKLPRGATKAEFMVMLQNLLAERFKLTLHREKKDLPMYALVVGKNGPKMKESVDDPAAPKAGGPADGPAATMGRVAVGKDGFPVLPGRGAASIMLMNGNARMSASGQSMARLAEMPVEPVGPPRGGYDRTDGELRFHPILRPGGPGGHEAAGRASSAASQCPASGRSRTGNAGGRRARRPIQSQSLRRPSGAARAEVGAAKRPGGSVGHRPFGEGAD